MSDFAMIRKYPESVEHASDWIGKLDRGLSEEEERQFEAWLFESDRNYVVFMEMAKLWDRMDILSTIGDVRPEASKSSSGRWHYALPVAATVALAAIFAWDIYTRDLVEPTPTVIAQESQVFETSTGQRSKYDLNDGTTIVLNTNTRVIVEYTSKNRLLYLEKGELHVEAASDPSRPLSVYLGDRVVQAVGTEFNVEISHDQSIEIVVTEGIVMVGIVDEDVANRISEEPILLPPTSTLIAAGQEVIVQATDAVQEEIVPDAIDDEEIAVKLSWRDGNLIFRGESLEEAISEVGRYTAVEFVFLDEDAKKRKVSGLFRAGDVEGLLVALRNNFNISYERVADDRIILGSADEE